MATEIIGWVGALTLLLTIGTQVVKQWQDRSSKGVSPWLFSGQVVASACFTVYSVLLGNVVFAVTNSLILASAVIGQLLYWRNQRGKTDSMTRLAGRVAGLFHRRRQRIAAR